MVSIKLGWYGTVWTTGCRLRMNVNGSDADEADEWRRVINSPKRAPFHVLCGGNARCAVNCRSGVRTSQSEEKWYSVVL
jgi:hypothetical protein